MVARRWIGIAVLLVTVGAARAFSGGTLVITDHPVDPKDKGFEKTLAKARKTALAKTGPSWHVYFVAYLSKPAGATELNIVFYPAGKKGEPTAFPIGTQESAKIVMSDLEISPENGITPGKYNVRITRLIGGKEVIYARADLELK